MRDSSWIVDAALLLLRRFAMLSLGIYAACGIGRLLSPAGAPPPVPGPASEATEVSGEPTPARPVAGGESAGEGAVRRPLSSAGPGRVPEADGGTASGEMTELRRRLLLPVAGVGPEDLMDSFAEPRGRSRIHQAIDIPAARNTPVLAADDGTVVRLLQSRLGGWSIYQLDSTGGYAFYYAHLEAYHRDLEEGERVRRGEVIGYVGTSGNAPAGAPHLHFAIYRVAVGKGWRAGEPINPYRVFGPVRRARPAR